MNIWVLNSPPPGVEQTDPKLVLKSLYPSVVHVSEYSPTGVGVAVTVAEVTVAEVVVVVVVVVDEVTGAGDRCQLFC